MYRLSLSLHLRVVILDTSAVQVLMNLKIKPRLEGLVILT